VAFASELFQRFFRR